MYSYKIEQAVRAASMLHKEQVRKGPESFPYITHLVGVAFLLRDYTNNEDVIVAALLHDTLEDTSYKADELEEDFGRQVRILVETVSEPKAKKGKKLTWKERKEHYLKQLENGPDKALLIAAADKIHNLRSAVDTFLEVPKQFKTTFGGTLDERIAFYSELETLFQNRLTSEIKDEYSHVLEQFKKFVTLIK